MIGTPAVRAWLAIIGSVLAFAALIENAGFVPAIVVSVVVASRGTRNMPMREALVLAACLAVIMSILFVGVLGQPLTLIVGL